MSNKFEQLLELLINEENDKAEALFHEIVVEKSRDIYEGLAETTEETVEETKEEAKVEETTEEKVEEATEESKEEETVGEDVEIADESKDETVEEESIEEVGGDATDELIKDVSAEEQGEAEENGEEMPGEEGEEEIEDRVVDLEDALDELKAEFEKMMSGDKGDEGEEEAEEATLAPAEMPMEAKKEKMDEYKIQKSADNSDKSDKSAKSPVKDAGTKMGDGAKNITKGGEEKGRPAPTAEKMGEFENTGGKDKSTSFKKEVKADTADHSDKSAKSPVAKK